MIKERIEILIVAILVDPLMTKQGENKIIITKIHVDFKHQNNGKKKKFGSHVF